jgi:hypothetical protein
MKDSNKENLIRCSKKLVTSEEIFIILSNLNEYSPNEIKSIYLIFKSLIKLCQDSCQEVQKFFYENIRKITDALFENLHKIKSDSVVFAVCKSLKRILKNDRLNENIISLQFFSEIFSFTKNENFVISFETFKILSVSKKNCKNS